MIGELYLWRDLIGPSYEIGLFEGEPECGEDFCDTCGDCLHCYAFNDGDCFHLWVVYIEGYSRDDMPDHLVDDLWPVVIHYLMGIYRELREAHGPGGVAFP